jgi:serine/threonine protein kinase
MSERDMAKISPADQLAMWIPMDIYALGIILHQVLTGDFPYNEIDYAAAGYDPTKIHDDPRKVPLERTGSNAPAPWMPILSKMLAFDPKARYQNCDELLADLAALESGTPSIQERKLGPTPGSGEKPVPGGDAGAAGAGKGQGKETVAGVKRPGDPDPGAGSKDGSVIDESRLFITLFPKLEVLQRDPGEQQPSETELLDALEAVPDVAIERGTDVENYLSAVIRIRDAHPSGPLHDAAVDAALWLETLKGTASPK